ncbi:PucR family transcriptional regulator [Streptomyces sp. NBC_01618]|uniref:PucR family transcriptional regulator n=1 Tax=Streptomyces sp. NBC_01618 TaxID=2975900 RepID=UPI00386F27A1|nr:PucR family transcriptional regulator ligand-binding domain-containing protein [Streptomyces sp. NBC_01618]
MTGSAPSGDFGQGLTVGELLGHEVMEGAELVAGRQGLSHSICALNVMTVPDIGPWVKPDEFLLATGYPLPRDDVGQAELLRGLRRLGLAGIGVKIDRYLPDLSTTAVATAEELGLPLVLIPEHIRFDDILSHTFSTIVNRQAAALERAHELHQSFLAVTLTGGGLNQLARKLSHLLGDAGVFISDQHGIVRTRTGDVTRADELDLVHDGRLIIQRLRDGAAGGNEGEQGHLIRPIRAGSLQHGFVVAIETSRAFGEFDRVAVDQAAVIAALEFTRDLAVSARERQFSSNALYELMTGAESEIADSAARGFGFGWDLDREVVVLVSRKDGADDHGNAAQKRLANERALEFWISAVHGKDRKAAAAGLGAELVAVVGAEHGTPVAVRSIQAEVAQFVRGEYAVGVSRVHRGPLGIPVAYQEARSALRVGRKIGGPDAVAAYDDLGLFKLLAQVEEAELQTFVDEVLGPLTKLPEQERNELLKTLETLVEFNMNMAETARHLHYHYNTLRYRLAKLERLLGPFSSSTATAVKVFVALQIRQMPTIASTHQS